MYRKFLCFVFRENNRKNNSFLWPSGSEVTKTHVFGLKTHIFRWKWWIFAIFVIFGSIWTQFRSKQLKIQPGSHFQSNRLDPIDSIRSTRLDSIESILSKMAIMAIFGLIWTQFRSIGLTRSDRIFQKYQVFSKIPCIHENHGFCDYFCTCFAKLPRIQKYRFYTGLILNMEKNLFRLSRKWKIRKKMTFALPYFLTSNLW